MKEESRYALDFFSLDPASARVTVLAGLKQRQRGQTEVRLVVVGLDWVGKEFVAQAKVQRELRRELPVVLTKECV